MRVLLGVSNMRAKDGGPPTVVGGLARALAAAGAEVAVMACTLPDEIASTRAHWHQLEDAGIGLHLFPYAGPPSLYYSTALPRFAAERAADFDVLHNHGVWELSLLAAARRWRARGKPYFVSSHGVLDPWSLSQSAWKKQLALRVLGTQAYLDNAAGLVFGSEDERNMAQPLGLRSEPLAVPNGVDLETPHGADPEGRAALIRKFPAIADWDRTVLFFARLHPKKGLDMLVEGFARIAGAFPKAGILAAAIPQDRGYEQAVRTRVTELGLADRIVITTELVGREGRWALDAADIFALPSHQEGFSMSLVEAMGRGLPLLITDRCHMNMVGPEGAGQVVPPNPQGLEDGLRALLAMTGGDMAAMGGRSRELAQQYAWPNVARQMLGHYEAAVRG